MLLRIVLLLGGRNTAWLLLGIILVLGGWDTTGLLLRIVLALSWRDITLLLLRVVLDASGSSTSVDTATSCSRIVAAVRTRHSLASG